ncbi:hypothetical protein LTR86_002699 [Recurvomyces mirabilis]|nr:hypothetical protein LTR86_002699 [Recurvomyces mirabilis]
MMLLTAVTGCYGVPTTYPGSRNEHDAVNTQRNITRTSKRWYSIQTKAHLEQANILHESQHEPGPDHDGSGDFGGKTPVRYCFADERSAEHLLKLVAHAIAQWLPIVHYSSASIHPDMACRIDGYDPSSDEPGRHFLIFGAYNHYNKLPSVPGGYFEYMVPSMMHEFGHLLGLEHEHQRPDRDLYVNFRCEYLEGYNAAEIAVMRPENDKYFVKVPSKARRMKLVCTTPSYAGMFFPSVLAYLSPRPPMRELRHPDWLAHGDVYDYASIMTYSSYTAARLGEEGVREGKAPLTRKLPNDLALGSKGVHGQQPWIILKGGGTTADARISTMDVIRIAAIYPGTESQQAAASALGPDHPWKAVEPWIPPNSGELFSGKIEPNAQDVVNRQLKRLSDEIPELSEQNRVKTADLNYDALTIGVGEVGIGEQSTTATSGKGKSKWKNRLSWLGKKGKGKDDQGAAGSSGGTVRRMFIA